MLLKLLVTQIVQLNGRTSMKVVDLVTRIQMVEMEVVVSQYKFSDFLKINNEYNFWVI